MINKLTIIIKQPLSSIAGHKPPLFVLACLDPVVINLFQVICSTCTWSFFVTFVRTWSPLQESLWPLIIYLSAYVPSPIPLQFSAIRSIISDTPIFSADLGLWHGLVDLLQAWFVPFCYGIPHPFFHLLLTSWFFVISFILTESPPFMLTTSWYRLANRGIMD